MHAYTLAYIRKNVHKHMKSHYNAYMPARMHGANRDPSVGVGANAAVASEVCGSRVGLELESLVPRNTHIRQSTGIYVDEHAR